MQLAPGVNVVVNGPANVMLGTVFVEVKKLEVDMFSFDTTLRTIG